MDLLGLEAEEAQQVIRKLIAEHKAYRFMLTVKARVYARIGADPDQLKAWAEELTKVELAIASFEEELLDIR